MLLDTICNSKVYHHNAYYLLGLYVGMTGRKLKRRIEDLQSAREMGVSEWNSVYDKLLLGSVTAPDNELIEDLIERIKDPEFTITESFFWFWPTSDGMDVALEAILTGDRTAAFNNWRSLSTKAGSEAIIAKHNLAVLFHYYAIDAENQRLSGKDGTETPQYLGMLEGFWRTTFHYWEMLMDDDDFWDVFMKRVRDFDDPRLDDNFVEEFRGQFPISFDNINADFLVSYAKAGKLQEAKRHFVYMTETMKGSDDVDETLNNAFKPQIDKLNIHIKHCRESKVDEDGLKDIRSVLNASKELFGIFSFLLPPDNRMYKDLKNDIAKTCHRRTYPYANKTEDFEGTLLVIKELLKLASSPSLKNSIEKDIAQLEKIVKNRREVDTCWYCKTFRKGTPKKKVKMYGEVMPNPERYAQRGVTYSTYEIQIPVCSNCSHKFSISSARSYPLIQKYLADGWKIGDGPSNADIDEAWNGLAGLMQLLGRRGY